MKTSEKFLLFSLFSISLLTAWSCNKDNETPSGVQQGPVKMRAVVDGQNWSAGVVSADTIGGRLSLVGVAGDGSTISLVVSGFSEGEYTSYPAASTVGTWQAEAGAPVYASNQPSGSGLIVIDELKDTIVSGTFFFTALDGPGGDSVSVRNGIFTEVRY